MLKFQAWTDVILVPDSNVVMQNNCFQLVFAILEMFYVSILYYIQFLNLWILNPWS